MAGCGFGGHRHDKTLAHDESASKPGCGVFAANRSVIFHVWHNLSPAA